MDQIQTTIGEEIGRWEGSAHDITKSQKKAAKIEKKLDRDMNDLVEYTKWISNEM